MTEYKRHQGRSYMILHARADISEYEYVMMSEYKIPGFVPVRMTESDACAQFWYDISGRQALSDWMERRQEGKELLKKILSALSAALDAAGEYLLSDNGVSLAPEKIFVDAAGEGISFCYMPFEKTDAEKALREFMEYYISHMQHGQREEAQLCYEVYEKSQQDGAKLEEMLKILFTQGEPQDVQSKEKEHSKVILEAEEEKKELTKRASCVKEVLRKYDVGKNIEKITRGRKNKKKRSFLLKKENDFEKTYVFSPEESGEKAGSETVLLGSEIEQTLGELKYEGSGNGQNLKIRPPVFLIGSRRGEADGVILDDTVSRIHARITKEEDNYYLEDLNSTNGTYYNGEMLNYKEKVRLEKNDRISFAKEAYRFV